MLEKLELDAERSGGGRVVRNCEIGGTKAEVMFKCQGEGPQYRS